MSPLDNLDRGTAADRPAPSPYNKDKFWFSNDTGELSVSDGSSWTTISGGGGGGDSAVSLDVLAPQFLGTVQNINSFSGTYGWLAVPLPVDPVNDRRWSINILGTRWDANHTAPFRLGVRLTAIDALAFDAVPEGGQGYVEQHADGNEFSAGSFGANLALTLGYDVNVPSGVSHTINIEENVGTFHPVADLPVSPAPSIQATARMIRVFATGVVV